MAGARARTAASLVGVNKTTTAFYFHRLREIVAQRSEDASPVFGWLKRNYLRFVLAATAGEVTIHRILNDFVILHAANKNADAWGIDLV